MVELDEELADHERFVEYLAHQSVGQLMNAKEMVNLKPDWIHEVRKDWEDKIQNTSERMAEFQLDHDYHFDIEPIRRALGGYPR
jgi:hypothetical protein